MKLTPFFRDILYTAVTQVFTLVGFFLIYRLIAVRLGADFVGEYSLIKRVGDVILPFMLLGFGMGLPRYIAMAKNKGQTVSYMVTGTLVVGGASFLFITFLIAGAGSFSEIFFGGKNHINLVIPLSVYLAGLSLFNLVYSFFRGKLYVKALNLLQIANIVILPIVILLFFGKITVGLLMTFIGIGTLVITSGFAAFLVKDLFAGIGALNLKKAFHELAVYSFPRFPSNIIWTLFLSLGPIFAAHLVSFKEIGYLSVSQSLLALIGTALSPLGLILLPKVSCMAADGRQEDIKKNLDILIGGIIQISVFGFFQVMILSDTIVTYWLGSEFLPAASILRITFSAVLFYAFFEALRNILDAVNVKPINTINLVVSLAVALAAGVIMIYIAKIFEPIVSLSIAFAFGLMVLGMLTYASVKKIYPGGLRKDFNNLFVAIGLNLILGAALAAAKPFIAGCFYGLAGFELILVAVYILALWFLRAEWIRKLPQRLLSR